MSKPTWEKRISQLYIITKYDKVFPILVGFQNHNQGRLPILNYRTPYGITILIALLFNLPILIPRIKQCLLRKEDIFFWSEVGPHRLEEWNNADFSESVLGVHHSWARTPRISRARGGCLLHKVRTLPYNGIRRLGGGGFITLTPACPGMALFTFLPTNWAYLLTHTPPVSYVKGVPPPLSFPLF